MKRAILLCVLVPAAAWAGSKASAFKTENRLGANYWNSGAAIDGKMETAWMVPGESPNRGEWIEIDVPRGDVDKIAIMPGWAKSEEQFGDYARLKQVRADIFSMDDEQNVTQVGSATITIADKMEMQVLDLPDTKVGDSLFGGKVRLTVIDYYPGADYPNFGVSELLVHMKEFDAPGVKVSGADNTTSGTTDNLTDGDAKTLWSGAAGTSFTIANNGFGLSSVGFQSAGKEYSRPKTIEITSSNQTVTVVLPDSVSAAQWAMVPGFNGYTGGGIGGATVKIIDTYPGTKADVGLAEMKFKATTMESF